MWKQVPAGGRILTIACSLPLLLLISAKPIPDQTTAQPGNSTISADVDLVVLHATVRGRKGGFVSGLGEGDFKVFEDGAPQIVRVFEHEDVPVAVGLVVDNSGSMSRKRKEVTAAALAFVRSIPNSSRPARPNSNGRLTAFRRTARLLCTMRSRSDWHI